MLTKLKITLVVLAGIFSQFVTAQDAPNPVKYTAHNKGKFYIYWGGNRDSYSKSDIHFKGADYDFTINNVSAEDHPVGWHINYINPTMMTIPQTNFRLGYFINDHYNISIGVDHMKYIMVQTQTVNIDGTYPASYVGNQINNGQVNLTDETFLTFEHTDGLNYINSEISRVDDFSKYLGITNTDKIQINLTEGIGGGVLYPKTNAKVLGKERHDDFHVSGYGIAAKAGINITFFKHYFIQGELKAGYINMPDIRTTALTNDTASQHFNFFQRIISFGGIFNL
jgi:hypothetical protein